MKTAEINIGEVTARSVIDFVNALREEGLIIGPGEVKEILQGLATGLVGRRSDFKCCLKSLCCGSRKDLPVFERLFEMFWQIQSNGVGSKTKVKVKDEQQKSSLIFLGHKKGQWGESEEEDSRSVSGASKVERLRKTDFSHVERVDAALLEEIAAQLFKQMEHRLKRRLKYSARGSVLNMGRTLRKSISKGGWPTEMVFQRKRPARRKLIVLLDISGSMDKYSHYLLRFVITLRKLFKNIEAFTFSTQLDRITPFLNEKGQKEIYNRMSQNLNSWSGGTRIGECLEVFNEKYSREVLTGSSVVLVFSDGLETGEVVHLEKALMHIKRRSRHLIWLNPLKGMKGYQPVQRGMATALPHLDYFMSAHNLDSLLKLENILINV
ncbi:MAG: VWA domain-containing protein [Cyclobacteriaceae bacterium]|nr:VWA domain-containing protein [Cyclobacteriaceae bacterium]